MSKNTFSGHFLCLLDTFLLKKRSFGVKLVIYKTTYVLENAHARLSMYEGKKMDTFQRNVWLSKSSTTPLRTRYVYPYSRAFK